MLHKEYHTIEIDDVQQEINFSILYRKGTGYRVSVVPVKRRKEGNFTIEEFGCMTGFNDTLLFATRQSAKQLEYAKTLLAERKEKYLQYFQLHGIKG